MKIVLFGEDVFTITALQSLVEAGHEVLSVVCPLAPGNRAYKALEKAAATQSAPFLHAGNVNAEETILHLQKTAADLFVCVHLAKILSKELYSIPPKGAINVHPSLLPKYRGLSPQHQALINGDEYTGITIHFIDEGVDTGAIILQEKIPLTPETYIYDLQVQLLSAYKRMIPDAITKMEIPGFKPGKQDASGASWAGPLKDHDREIDTKKTKFEIYNRIRAVSKPYKGAWHGNITVWTSFLPDPATENRLLKEYPGTGLYQKRDLLVIRLHDGILLSDDFEAAG